MSLNKDNYLYTSLDKCCQEHFNWNYKECMGLLPGDCARGNWFPDWHGSNEGCVSTADEEAEPYMEANPMYYMYSSVQACCKEHYNWMYDDCLGTASAELSGLYYPDWKTQSNVCKKDGKQPQYMNNAPDTWMHKSGKDCCALNFGWNYKECAEAVGEDSGSEKGENDGKYYPGKQTLSMCFTFSLTC